jgi:CRP/FNR family transcriptional regulator, nitrogen fixation regulation protein
MRAAHASNISHSAPTILLRSAPLSRMPQEAMALRSSRTIAKDGEIFAEGDRPAFIYKVASGAVRTFKLLSDGRRQIDAFHLPGDIFGIETGEEHRFTAEALADATIILYRRYNLGVLPLDGGDFSRQIMTAMMRSLEHAQNHMLLLERKNALEKVATFLLVMAKRISNDDQVDLPMSRLDIADHLGLTIVSRSLTQLERRGIIDLPAHRSIVLRDRDVLGRLNS